jgi:hypothetical protein
VIVHLAWLLPIKCFVKTGRTSAGRLYLLAVVALCLPSFVFVIGAALPKRGGDLGEIWRFGAGMVLVLGAPPLTLLSVPVAVWATLRRGVDVRLKAAIWFTVAAALLAVGRIASVAARVGV